DEDRGLIKLARYRNTTQAGGSVVVLTTNYDEICTEPCGVPVDVTERPLFLFVRDGAPVSYGFRLKDDQEQVTLSLRPHRGKMHISGVLLTCFFIYPVGIPLIILGKAKVSIAPGAPSPGQKFRKLRKAKR